MLHSAARVPDVSEPSGWRHLPRQAATPHSSTVESLAMRAEDLPDGWVAAQCAVCFQLLAVPLGTPPMADTPHDCVPGRLGHDGNPATGLILP